MQKEFRKGGGGGEQVGTDQHQQQKPQWKQNKENPIHSHCSANPEVENEGEEDGLEAAESFYATWDAIVCLSPGNIPHGDRPITGNPT